VQVDELLFDRGARQGLAGSAARVRRQPCFERLDVSAFEVGAAGHFGVVLSQPGAEHPQVLLDVVDRRWPEAQGDLLDVATGGHREPGRGHRPPGDRHWLAPRWPTVVVEAASVEQREAEPVEHRCHVAAGLGLVPRRVRIDDCLGGGSEGSLVDLIGWDAGDSGDHGQAVPLDLAISLAHPDPVARFGEPGVRVGAVRAGSGSEAEGDPPEHVGVDGELSGHHQPRGERTGLADRVELAGPAHLAPAPSSIELDAKARAAPWLRTLRSTGETVYSGWYGTTTLPDRSQPSVRVVFPLPNGSVTVFLRPEVTNGGGLRLVSPLEPFGGDGAYLVVRDSPGASAWARRVPIVERFDLYVDDEGVLRTNHSLRLW
jgi:hypothetical protein